jgi:trans-aconitate 2-methyltransferase
VSRESEATKGPTWDPIQYERFRRERAQPFFDLLRRLPEIPVQRAADLGCGTGDLTRLLLERWPTAQVWGVDNSAEMLSRAGSGVASRLTWVQADLRDWRAPAPLDVIMSNAALHWVPGHAQLLAHLTSQLSPGGILAVQLPHNRAEPAYRLVAESIKRPCWAGRFPSDILQITVESAAWYIRKLQGLGFHAEVWETIYYHQLPDAAAIVEWLKGTAMRPLLSMLSQDEAAVLLQELHSGIARIYPTDTSGVIFPFRRLFFIASRNTKTAASPAG